MCRKKTTFRLLDPRFADMNLLLTSTAGKHLWLINRKILKVAPILNRGVRQIIARNAIHQTGSKHQPEYQTRINYGAPSINN